MPLSYEFHKDINQFFHKTRYINELLRIAETKYVAVWDTDVIASPVQILESANTIRDGKSGMSIPYDGRVFVCDYSLSAFVRSNPYIHILERLSASLPLMYGYHSTGGAIMINRIEYLEIGGENENFYGWGPEDVDRVKRMEIMSPEHPSSPAPCVLSPEQSSSPAPCALSPELLRSPEMQEVMSEIPEVS